jgi:hypothetical protein
MEGDTVDPVVIPTEVLTPLGLARVGDRVSISPCSVAWERGFTHGVVVAIGSVLITVKEDAPSPHQRYLEVKGEEAPNGFLSTAEILAWK